MFHMHMFIESIDCILLPSFELKAVLLISSVKTCLSRLNLYCVCDIILLFFMNFYDFFKTMLILFFAMYFSLFSSLVDSKQFL